MALSFLGRIRQNITTVKGSRQKIYIYIYRERERERERGRHFFAEESHLHDLVKVPVGARMNPQVKFILASPIACVTNQLTVFFFIDTAPSYDFSNLF